MESSHGDGNKENDGTSESGANGCLRGKLDLMAQSNTQGKTSSYTQTDYDKTFCPVVTQETLRVLIDSSFIKWT